MELSKALSESQFQKWISREYRTTTIIQKLNNQFKNNPPFAHLELENFFNREELLKVLKALNEEEFIEKEADLFKFKQTLDFTTTSNALLLELRKFLSSKAFITYMEAITEIKLKENQIDLSGFIYQNTDYLLPHDDQLKGRKIAFMTYLSDLEDKDGGKLILYKTKGTIPRGEEKVIIPKLNKFVFFKVSEKSFHEIEEVIVNKQRITIGGWLHGAYNKSSISQEREY